MLPWPEGTRTAERDHWTARGIFGGRGMRGSREVTDVRDEEVAVREDQQSAAVY